MEKSLNRAMYKHLKVAVMMCVVIMPSGCYQAGPTFYQVSGKVTHNGQPVPMGEVIFTPNSAEGNSGPSVVCSIVDGEYRSPPQRGVVGGKYIAVVSGFKKSIPSNDPTASEFGARLFPVRREVLELPSQNSELNFDF